MDELTPLENLTDIETENASTDTGLTVELPKLSILPWDSTGLEGDDENSLLTFLVRRTGSLDATSRVAFQVESAALRSVDEADFVGGVFPAGEVVFAEGQAEALIFVAVQADLEPEDDEIFQVSLTDIEDGILSVAAAFGVVTNDDTAGQLRNQVPVANADHFMAAADEVITGNLLADNGFGTDLDDALDGLVIVEINGALLFEMQSFVTPAGGLLLISDDGNFTYDPNGIAAGLAPGEHLVDEFSYTVLDVAGETAQGVVTVEVAAAAVVPATSVAAIGETGTVFANQKGAIVTLDHHYENPVVFVQVASAIGAQPVVARVSDIQGDQFTVYLEEPSAFDNRHYVEEISYLVIEAGDHVLADGTRLLAGVASLPASDQDAAGPVLFDEAFETAPIMMTALQDNLDGDFAISQHHGVSQDGFSLSVVEEAAADGVHGEAQIGWLALEEGFHSAGSGALQAGRALIDGAGSPMPYSSLLGGEALVLGSAVGGDQTDLPILRLDAMDGSSVPQAYWQLTHAFQAPEPVEGEVVLPPSVVDNMGDEATAFDFVAFQNAGILYSAPPVEVGETPVEEDAGTVATQSFLMEEVIQTASTEEQEEIPSEEVSDQEEADLSPEMPPLSDGFLI